MNTAVVTPVAIATVHCLCGRMERVPARDCTLVVRNDRPWLAFTCRGGRPMAVPLNTQSLALMLATPALRDPDFRDWHSNRKAIL